MATHQNIPSSLIFSAEHADFVKSSILEHIELYADVGVTYSALAKNFAPTVTHEQIQTALWSLERKGLIESGHCFISNVATVLFWAVGGTE